MDSGKCVVSGEKVAVYSLCDSNMEEYLSVFGKASAFTELYENNPDMWEFVRKDIKKSIENRQDNIDRYLIVEKDTYITAGYFNLTYSEKKRPEVDIAVVREYRRKGYAFEAAKLLINYIFENQEITSVIWSAFSSNAASCRIAEKLGGVLIDGKNLIKEAMMDAGFKFEFVNVEEKILETVTYEIKRSNWTE